MASARLTLFVLVTLSSVLHSLSAYAQTTSFVPGGMAKLTFADEFNGPSLDRSKWSTNYTNVMVNLPGELQIYVPDAFDIANGQLKIRADRRRLGDHEYTSGAMTTYGAFEQRYGYFEIRAKVPKGRGLWPALWMLPADKSWPPEIDIMEFLGRDPANVWMTYHWTDKNGQKQKDGSGATAKDWTADFHTYGLQWRPGLIVWYIDGKEMKRLTGPHVPSAHMFLLMNLAMGGSWAGPPDNTTPFPSEFLIDYVRAYQYDDMLESDDRRFRYLTTQSNRQTVRPGEEVRFDFGVENRSLSGPIRFQLILTHAATQKRVANFDAQVPMEGKGEFKRVWTYALPKELPKGLYVVSFGLFTPEWQPIDWLNNSKTILVE